MKQRGYQGISRQLKDRLIQQALERRARRAEKDLSSEIAPLRDEDAAALPRFDSVPERYYRFHLHPGYQQIRIIKEGAAKLGIDSPFFRVHDGIAGSHTQIAGRDYLNYSSYNYLGLNGDPRVSAAAHAAIERYGTSVSASRLVAGERAVHRELERALAEAHGVEDCLVLVSGHATNVTSIGCLLGTKDLVVHDALIHNSVLQGIQLSGAKRMVCPHNDWRALDELLKEHRTRFERVLIVVDGIYSMDGDFPELPRYVEIKRRHRAFLMVDEAHSFGVMGSTGMGIAEHFGVAGGDVDIWMGTLSKALASCGGYIAGEAALVEYLKFAAPGFLYSVGMAPPVAAAALEALRILRAEPGRVTDLQARGQLFLERAREAGIDTGRSAGFSVVPAIVGSSVKAARLANAMFSRGIEVQPIMYPAVEEQAARLRFFLSSQHRPEDIETTVTALAEELARL
jgi:8-amino-7-oxononanoate synthase